MGYMRYMRYKGFFSDPEIGIFFLEGKREKGFSP